MKNDNKSEEETKKIIKKKLSKFNKNSFKTTEVLFLIITTSFVSLIVGYLLNGNTELQSNSDPALAEIIENYHYILDNYYEDVSKEDILSGAIDGMIRALGDDYSQLLEEESSSSFYMNLEGSYEGIGIEIYNNDNNDIVVLGVLEDSPAEKAGIKSGDIIKKIDDINFENTNITELTKYIKETEKETYILEVIRGEEKLSFELKRSEVIIKSVLSKTFERNNHKIGYIYISVFSNSTPDQFRNAIKTLEENNIDSLIIDVRENSGGHLTTVVSLLSELLDSSHIIYQIEKNGEQEEYYSVGNKDKNYPIVVLQNGNSASASELMSAALKEEYGATIIGETSYGKGTVQEVVGLSNGDTYKFTTKKWLTPKGNWIHKVGVTPNIEVSLEEAYFVDPKDDTDNQLQTAIDYLAKESNN